MDGLCRQAALPWMPSSLDGTEQQAGRTQGIKAIVLYPMNALAADQAGRFAEAILTSEHPVL